MKTITVALANTPYKIYVGEQLICAKNRLLQPLAMGKDVFVLSNKTVYQAHGKKLHAFLSAHGLRAYVHLVGDSETSKSLRSAISVLQAIVRFDRQKDVSLVAFGGGVIGDLAGFCASIYKRGIPLIHIPTTLLAQVDASIGGKTAVDLPQGKNLIGSFYQPKAVLSDATFLKTLPTPQLACGLAEVVKYGIIKDVTLFSFIEQNYHALLLADSAALSHVIEQASRIKAKIVTQDERETRSIRTILNFGHTIGHALEAAGNYRRYNHGQAVALGMLCAADISAQLGLMPAATVRRIETLLANLTLPVQIKHISLNTILSYQFRDKKFSGKTNRWVLISGRIGRVCVKQNIPLAIIRAAVAKRMASV